ncbi:MAG TPA: molybdopterin molybdotransferase MoeA [Ignavibacteria bacterium]|nr:molybdopterin molybdotransferase MoeA [Ignavibacteria bacterium]
MISVEEAKRILIENTIKADKTCTRSINNCSGYFTSSDIFSSVDLPPFDQSNVDGYATAFSKINSRKIINEIKAGDNPKCIIKSGEAVRIFTGAVVPKGTDFIVMQENVIRNQNRLILNEFEIKKGNFIRPKGSQIKKGELAVAGNTFVTPAVAGFIAALGIEKIKVFKKPEISLIITGSELQTPGVKLKPGMVYDSNSYLIRSALKEMGLKISKAIFIKDIKSLLKKHTKEIIDQSDLVLISGGVSVGMYDFVNEILEELGVSKLFYKVAQRPGKPLYFGKAGSTYVFGLPGNPASVFTCFYEYVYPLLRKLLGFRDHFLQSVKLQSEKELNKSFNLGNFLKARMTANGVEPLDGQASYILRTFTGADCLIYLPAGKLLVKKGEEVEVHLLPDHR